jgi:hypothetical protein
MGSYGYSEAEAMAILQEEIKAGETALMEGYAAWETSPAAKSEELRRYAVLLILALGGLNYWQVFSRRYNGPLTTTAEDRAQLVQKDLSKLRRLDGHPLPAVLAGLDHLAQQSLLVPGGEQTNGGHRSNGDVGRQASNPAQRVDFCAPFKKAAALDVCHHFSPSHRP